MLASEGKTSAIELRVGQVRRGRLEI